MPAMTMEERLGEMGRQIDELAAKASTASGEAKSHIERQIVALREQEASTRAAAQRAADGLEEKFEQFEARLRVAQSSAAADLAGNRQVFADAVDDELHKWDAYFERLQAQAALRAATTRDHAEVAISELRRRRNEIAAHLDDVRTASAEGWDEQKQRFAAARAELERKADELSAQFK
jgi:hypothetical protein